MALCAQHAAIIQAGREYRLNSAAGYATQRLPVYGGTLDGIENGLAVPYDLRNGDQWMVAVVNGQLEKYEVRSALDYNLRATRPATYLQYVGPAVPPPAPGAPEHSDSESPQR
jgi:hypothetical protein